MNKQIPFNKPYLTGKETHYIYQAVHSGKISGNGEFTKKCQLYFEDNLLLGKSLLTTSCTDALEMSAILIHLKEGDEVILPSYTFVSTANAFVLRGAKLVFADSNPDNPNMDAQQIESLISPKTKAIVVVHYAGIACDMDPIQQIAKKYNLFLIEDAAQAVDSYYKGKALGSFGDLSAFSFHETKNIQSGEGGLLGINNINFEERAEIIWEKGTNRAAFFRGEVDKYGWVDIGSSFLPSEIIAAFLFAQIENIQDIQKRRKEIWDRYKKHLSPVEGKVQFPFIPSYATNNAHMFYLVCSSLQDRTALVAHLKSKGIYAAFHYISLHSSPYYQNKHDGRILKETDRYSDCLLRLPLYYELSDSEVDYICQEVLNYYGI
jgi:dTDP-4-amino-4,6-dideoxygalactose transaminase